MTGRRILPPATDLVALIDQGLTLDQIGARHGVSKTAVLAALRRAGIGPRPRLTPQERWAAKVNHDGPPPDHRPELGPCWLWTGADDGHGYGAFRLNGRTVKAYRFGYEQEHGPVSDGLQLDHLCRVRLCVRPAHLEPVTQRENILRGDSPGATAVRTNRCKRGHEFTPENTYVTTAGRRRCLACR